MKTDLTQGKAEVSGFENLISHGATDKKHVYKYYNVLTGEFVFKAHVGGWSNFYKTKKDAGINVDIRLIQKGKNPLNYLVKK